MSETVDAGRPRTILGMTDDPNGPLLSDPFIGAFVGLGSLLRRHIQAFKGRQLVVAISVPCRDFAAALIGTGWMLKAPVPELADPIDVFRWAEEQRQAGCQPYLRAVTEKNVVAGAFAKLDETKTPPRVTIGGKTRHVDWYKAVVPLSSPCENVEDEVADPGFLGELTDAGRSWRERTAAPAEDLVLVGTAKWLMDDLRAYVGNGASHISPPVRLENYVLPAGKKSATWATVIIPSARLGEGAAIPSHCALAILDRYGAIKYLNEIETPIVLCVIDRSVADESAAELVVQARVANSRPISVRDDLRWKPPVGVEALAFTVAL
ncbi:MAG: hypothetical protein K1X67_26895 [Fimbriimonadaceae bacterium]|nr:hypothetical protein [Fimbriimonadaceae bacterium]